MLAQLTSVFCQLFLEGLYFFPWSLPFLSVEHVVIFHGGFSVNNNYTKFQHKREAFFLINYKCHHLLTLCSNYLQLLLPVD